ncbi:hypothetical protein [Pseudomonas aeruginosa]|uniref:hypothetical protein n=1 Tax=Pseudomonas aeruginosa TaxID=287 RepID=UPI0005BCF4B5|nr:hypothetical protein [Pseudomonas aeruginosa]MBN0170557.1 hypothetical protein [Pseudomonas aeruginosa]MCV4086357.1 hypothetical protein [Pseudomonas aeruginosa]MCV4123508.1 hypothetical protein [Pseudomonas aeruginosa]RQD47917.1 hypothetical protein IPC327_04385 [Pseudomonas aeruginosa]HBO0950892.1 hypothetical protein [Pseudomonas aeruginosa]
MQSEAETFNFRISFKLSGSNINVDQERVRIFEGKEIFLTASTKGALISHSNQLAIEGEGFETYRAAGIEMLKLEQAMKLAALEQHFGICTANSGYGEYPCNVVLREMEHNYILKGIIFKQLASRRAYPASMVVWDPEPSQEFESIDYSKLSAGISKYYAGYYVAFPMSSVIDMLGAIHFEYSSMVRLILSMTVIEMLAGSGGRRSDEEQAVIDELVQKIQESSLSKDQKGSLAQAVGGCKKYSIGKSCRKFVSQKLGKDQAKAFNDLYNYRSRLVHSGEIDEPLMSEEERETQIYKAAGEAYVMASKLVDVVMESHRNTGEPEFAEDD